ncbi:18140_t:CDS:2, partial [Gigaspora margarita]
IQLVVFSSDICANDNKTRKLTKDLLSIIIVFVVHIIDYTLLPIAKTQAIQKFQEESNETSSRQDEAINDLLKEYTSNIATKCKSHGVFSFLHKIKSAESLPKQLGYDSCLVINCLGKFYLCIPEPLEQWAKNQGRLGVIALDPGVCTFMTGYDPSGIAIEWGKNNINRIYRLCHVYDRLQSKQDMIHGKGNERKHYRLRRVMLRIHKRIRCLVHECHCKLTKWLCENYRIIILPEFRTQRMIRRGQRRIGSKTARAMCTWSHFRFRQHLAHKARECRIIICTEEYTSKLVDSVATSTASWVDLKDINGARNILLRYLTRAYSLTGLEVFY